MRDSNTRPRNGRPRYMTGRAQAPPGGTDPTLRRLDPGMLAGGGPAPSCCWWLDCAPPHRWPPATPGTRSSTPTLTSPPSLHSHRTRPYRTPWPTGSAARSSSKSTYPSSSTTPPTAPDDPTPTPSPEPAPAPAPAPSPFTICSRTAAHKPGLGPDQPGPSSSQRSNSRALSLSLSVWTWSSAARRSVSLSQVDGRQAADHWIATPGRRPPCQTADYPDCPIDSSCVGGPTRAAAQRFNSPSALLRLRYMGVRARAVRGATGRGHWSCQTADRHGHGAHLPSAG